jgi:hypothetical protein
LNDGNYEIGKRTGEGLGYAEGIVWYIGFMQGRIIHVELNRFAVVLKISIDDANLSLPLIL